MSVSEPQLDMLNLTEEQIEGLEGRQMVLVHRLAALQKKVGKVSDRTLRESMKEIEDYATHLFDDFSSDDIPF